ncbi:hypothetical protein [Bacillus haynesii]|uniref:hypothetical protein n=1 Tax=Bacillus haynesii TaxID=1925021 RepID=UPI003990AB9A
MTKTNEKIHVLTDESLGGIKREYVEVDRKAKEGEKIVIVDVILSFGTYHNGDVFGVATKRSASVRTACGKCIYDEEYRVLEPTNIVNIDGDRYEMVDRPPEIGGKVLRPSDGFVAEVVDFDIHYVYVPGAGVYADDLLTLVPAESSEEEPRPSDPIDVIANLATRVAELECENKRIKEDLGWNEMGPGRIANLRNDVSDIRHAIAALEERVDNDYEESDAWAGSVNEKMSRLQDEIDTLHKDSRMLGEELEALKAPAKSEACAPIDAPLVFVQRKSGDKFDVYQDGKKLRGVKTVRIDAALGEFTTHEIEYVSGETGERQ